MSEDLRLDSAEEYSLILCFDPNNSNTRENVKHHLMRLSPTIGSRIEIILKNGKVVLKEKADRDADQHIVELFKDTGAECRFVNTVSARPIFQDAENRNLPQHKPVSDNNEMICPKCNRPQKEAPECCHCGVIIAKVRSRPTISENPSTEEMVKKNSAFRTWLVLKDKYRPYVTRSMAWFKGSSLENTSVRKWSQQLTDALLRCVVVFLVALILEIGLLLLAKYMWIVFSATTVGQFYLEKHVAAADMLRSIMQSDLVPVGFQAVITVACLGVMAGIVGQLTNLIRLFYQPSGFLGRTIFWALPLSVLSAWYLSHYYIVPHFHTSFAITLFPSLLLLPSCLHLARNVAPELGTSIRIFRDVTRTFSDTCAKLMLWLNKIKR